jgi:hypothetical protein
MAESSSIAVANPFVAEQSRELKGSTASTDVAVQRELAEVQAAVLMARRFPRDPVQSMDAILRACTRPTLAEGALYQYARGGKDITGPSIRLAEAMAQVWSNLAFGIRELEQRSGESTMEAYCWDMETNVRQSRVFQVRHERYTKTRTYKLTDPRDIYEANANQGARRLRACILGVIPGDVVEAAVTQCEETMRADVDTSPEALKRLVEAFGQFGVTREMLEARIQRRIEAIRPAQIINLRKIWASLSDNMSEPGDWFETAAGQQAAPPSSGNEALRQRLRPAAQAPEPEPKPPEPEPEPEPVEEEPPMEEPAAAGVPVITPQRLHPGSRSRTGWNWAGFADEVIKVAEGLPAAGIAEFRAANASMINSLQLSDKEGWSRVQQALAGYERGEEEAAS